MTRLGRPDLGGHGQRGSTTLELVVWAPGLLLLIGLLTVAGRVNSANAAVEQAATDAARTASLARTAASAEQQARQHAQQTLATQGLACTATTVTVDTAGFGTAPGQPATVVATVSCPVRLSDLALPGLPGTRTVTHTAVSSLDTFRERALGFAKAEAFLASRLRVSR
jgi:Flp pilus assembly protein TadG